MAGLNALAPAQGVIVSWVYCNPRRAGLPDNRRRSPGCCRQVSTGESGNISPAITSLAPGVSYNGGSSSFYLITGRKHMHFKVSRSLVLGLALLVSSTGWSAENGFYIAPGVQWMDFGDEAMLDEDTGFFLGLGFEFNDKWAAEISTFKLEPDRVGGGELDDVDHYKIDLLYDLDSQLGNFQPFIVGGVGNNNYDGENDTLLDLGIGLKYDFSDTVVWRTAFRGYDPLGQDDLDFGIDSSLIIYFGERNRSRPARAEDPAPARPTTASTPSAPAARPETPAPRDSDGDGVPDSEDDCPNTPRNYAVDADGCPIPVEEIARVELLVNFEFDRSEVRPQYFSEIEEVADFMNQYPDVIVELEGHTDSRGTQEYNQGLSERRANAVREVLVNRFGISGARVSAQGFGESQPIASNDTDAGRAQNRRVITVIIKTLQNYQPR